MPQGVCVSYAIMSQYRHSPLVMGPGSIRLLRLLPHNDDTADIQCELFEYPLQKLGNRNHTYEALSYVWGDPDKTLPIYIHGHSFNVTINLRAALARLRTQYMERILWIDAICIDQANKEEQERQIRFMASIYGQASRVLVWLGEAQDDSDLAIKEIRCAGGKNHAINSDNTAIQQAVLVLLQRPWFRRIWILQEVAAARHVLIVCGAMEIHGFAFCLGVESLEGIYGIGKDSQKSVNSVTYLIMAAISRRGYTSDQSNGVSLGICPLHELVDMYHAHEATKRHDKVFALLGMSSDDLNKAGLVPDYQVPWDEIFRRLIKFFLSDKMLIHTWDDKEIAIIKSRGITLGHVFGKRHYFFRSQDRGGKFILETKPGEHTHERYTKADWGLAGSAESVQAGDVICLLEGASAPTIVRPCKDYFTIIRISVVFSAEGHKWLEYTRKKNPCNRNFLLVWDWELSSMRPQNLENHGDLLPVDSWVSQHTSIDSRDDLNRANRAWDCALILEDSGEDPRTYRMANEMLANAIRSYEKAFEKKDSHCVEEGLDPLSWAAINNFDEITGLLLERDGIDLDRRDNTHGRTALQAAAHAGHEVIVQLLLKTGKVDVNSRNYLSQTPLHLAAEKGHNIVCKLLLETSTADITLRDSNKQIPLHLAAENGHNVVCKLLLETDIVMFDFRDDSKQTPLHLAASNGHDEVCKLLLETGMFEIDFRDGSNQTPLHLAAENGHDMVCKLLLERGMVEVDSRNGYKKTPLHLAAEKGRDEVCKLLLETGEADINSQDDQDQTPMHLAALHGHDLVCRLLSKTDKAEMNAQDLYEKTPLHLAARNGHDVVCKLLLETGIVEVSPRDGYKQTPLHLAAENGHDAVCKLLLCTGEADINSQDKQDQTPVHLAALNGHDLVCKRLLKTGTADISLRTSDGATPLHLAAQNGYNVVCTLLLKTGKARINSRDIYMRTTLHLAAKNGHDVVCKLLLGTGKAKTDARDSDGRTPLHLAAMTDHHVVIELLQSHPKKL